MCRVIFFWIGGLSVSLMMRCGLLCRFSIFISWVGVGVLMCSGWFVLRSILNFRVLLWMSFCL